MKLLRQCKSRQFSRRQNNVASLPVRPGNWFAVSRTMFMHPIVGAGKAVKPADPKKPVFSKMEAWLWIIANAKFTPRDIDYQGRVLTLRRGQLLAARSLLGREWNWSDKSVRTFLVKLVSAGMVKSSTSPTEGQQKGHGTTIITLCNYERYQSRDHQKGPSLGRGMIHHSSKQRSRMVRPESIEGPDSNNGPLDTEPLNKETNQHLSLSTIDKPSARARNTSQQVPSRPRGSKDFDELVSLVASRGNYELQRVQLLRPLLSMPTTMPDLAAWLEATLIAIDGHPNELITSAIGPILRHHAWLPPPGAIHDVLNRRKHRDEALRAAHEATEAIRKQFRGEAPGGGPGEEKDFRDWLGSKGLLETYNDRVRVIKELTSREWTWPNARQPSKR